MSKIIRATCTSNSFDDEFHRVKVTSEGSFKDLLLDNVNGIYLRKGDDVYIFLEEDFINPLILGRCSGQLEIQDLLDLINNLISVFNKHTHKIPSGFLKGDVSAASILTTLAATAAAAAGVPPPTITSSMGTDETGDPTDPDIDKIKPDDILY